MKHNLYFFVIISLIANSCTAMELPLTCQEEYATFLDNNTIIIQANRSCRITDITTKKNIKIFEALSDGMMYVHPNKKHFALSQIGIINIYETKNGENRAWFLRSYFDRLPIYFNPSNQKDLFTWKEIKELGSPIELRKYDYITQTENATGITNVVHTGDPAMDIHPTQQRICIQDKTLNFYEYNEKDKRFIKFQEIENFKKKKLSLIKYSPDGSLIACLDDNSVDIINSRQEYSSFYNPHNNIFSLEFHPNNQALAILYLELKQQEKKIFFKPKDFNLILEYHNINEKNIIAKISLSDLYPSYMLDTTKKNSTRALSFSPDGTKLGILLKGKYLILPVPFEIHEIKNYEKGTQKKLLYLLFIFKNYENNLLPNNIINLFIKTALTTYKR